MQKIATYLWFDNNAEDAINLYTSLFEDSKVLNMQRYPEGAPGPIPAGHLMSATFQLAGQEFIVLNGGPQFKFNEAISLFVHCKDQAEVDRYWNALTADGGEESMCGWLKDKFGLSWQIVPDALMELLSDPNPARAQAAMQAMLQMQKIDIAALQAAADGV
jgi:predicted 3-demethylubiquinone-9 3-methyltransferase (glyoxalase superfamily)